MGGGRVADEGFHVERPGISGNDPSLAVGAFDCELCQSHQRGLSARHQMKSGKRSIFRNQCPDHLRQEAIDNVIEMGEVEPMFEPVNPQRSCRHCSGGKGWNHAIDVINGIAVYVREAEDGGA